MILLINRYAIVSYKKPPKNKKVLSHNGTRLVKTPAVPPKLMKNHPLYLALTYEPYCNGYEPSIATHVKTLSVALISPFAKTSATVLPPPTALLKHQIKVTPLNHGFFLM